MTWIASHGNLAQHPKTRKLARRLDISIPEAMGHLHCLWHWSLEHAFDGDLSGYEPEDIAIGAMWEGDPDDFLKALIEAKGRSGVGFVEQDGGGLRLHDWMSYTTHLRARREAAGKANHARWHVSRGVNDPTCEWCRNPDGDPEESVGSPNESVGNPNGQEPESTQHNTTEHNQKTVQVPQTDPHGLDAFERFWDRYPNQRNGKKPEKSKAEDQWKKLTPSERRRALIAVEHYRIDCDGGTFAKHAFRWLRDKTFEDWQTPAAPKPPKPRDRFAEMADRFEQREEARNGRAHEEPSPARRSLPAG